LFSASLHQQQRSEIIYQLLVVVNSFFSLSLLIAVATRKLQNH